MLALGQVQLVEKADRGADGQLANLGDVVIRNGHGQRLRLEAASLAGGARLVGHVPLQLRFQEVRLRLLVAALKVRDHALERRLVPARVPVLVLVAESDLAVAGAVEKHLALLLGQLRPRLVHVDAEEFADRLQQLWIEELRAAPRRDGALAKRQRRVGHDQVPVDHELRADPGARRACAMRAVEREVARLRLGHAGPVVGTRECHRHLDLFSFIWSDDHQAAAKSRRRLDRFDEPRPLIWTDDDPVDDDLDVVLLVLVERYLLGQLVQAAVDSNAHKPRLAHVVDQRSVLALATLDDRAQHHHARSLGQLLDVVRHLVDRLPADLAAAHGTVRVPYARVKEAQVVVNLCDRTDRRARVLRRSLLVDGDRRRQPLDGVHVGLLHLAEELARIRAQRFHVAPLAFGVDRVEGQRRLAGARQPGEHDELVTRDRQRDVLQVVLARAADRDVVYGHWAYNYSFSRVTENVPLAVATSFPPAPSTRHSVTTVRRPA